METMPVVSRTRTNSNNDRTEMDKQDRNFITKELAATKESEKKLKREIDRLKAAQEKLDESIEKWESISIKHHGFRPPVVISKSGAIHENKKQPVASPILTWHTKCGWPYGASNFSFGMDPSTVTCLKCTTLAQSTEEHLGKGGA